MRAIVERAGAMIGERAGAMSGERTGEVPVTLTGTNSNCNIESESNGYEGKQLVVNLHTDSEGQAQGTKSSTSAVLETVTEKGSVTVESVTLECIQD